MDGHPRLHKVRDKQGQMGPVRCGCPHDLAPSQGQRREPVSPPLLSPPNLHVKSIPHGRGVDHRLIHPVRGSGYPDRVFLYMTQLLQAKRLGWFTAQLNVMDKIYGCSVCHRGKGWWGGVTPQSQYLTLFRSLSDPTDLQGLEGCIALTKMTDGPVIVVDAITKVCLSALDDWKLTNFMIFCSKLWLITG